MNVRRRLVEQRDDAQLDADRSAASPAGDRSAGDDLLGPRGELSRMFALAESPKAFWDELIATLDEFAAVVRASRERISELSSEITRRDSVISLLETKNAALQARLGIVDGASPNAAIGQPPRAATAVDSAPAPASVEPAVNDRGIWRRLIRLERG